MWINWIDIIWQTFFRQQYVIYIYIHNKIKEITAHVSTSLNCAGSNWYMVWHIKVDCDWSDWKIMCSSVHRFSMMGEAHNVRKNAYLPPPKKKKHVNHCNQSSLFTRFKCDRTKLWKAARAPPLASAATHPEGTRNGNIKLRGDYFDAQDPL